MTNWPQYVALAWIAFGFINGLRGSARSHKAKMVAYFMDFAILSMTLFVLYRGVFWAPLGFAP